MCRTAATVQPFALTSDTQCTVCQGHILLELYTVNCLPGTHFTVNVAVYCLSGTPFTGTVGSVLSVRDSNYWICTQCTVCQGLNLL